MKDWRQRTLRNRFRDLVRHETWNIGVVRAPIHSFLERGKDFQVDWFPRPPPERFLADPFGIVRDGRRFVFCEDFDFRASKGVISSFDLSDRSFSETVALDFPFHASYPYLLEHRGEVYCIPETNAAREVALYAAEDFPRRWVKRATLIRNFRGVDSTVFPYQGRWWLLCTDFGAGTSDRLFIWHAADLLGPWEPHAANPVKQDLASARPGGTPFVHEGQLYRPTQDCSRSYGWRIVLNRVRRLTPTEFEEEPAGRVEPPHGTPYRAGLHTLSALGDWTLVDGKRFVFSREEFDRSARDEWSLWTRAAGRILHKA